MFFAVEEAKNILRQMYVGLVRRRGWGRDIQKSRCNPAQGDSLQQVTFNCNDNFMTISVLVAIKNNALELCEVKVLAAEGKGVIIEASFL